jgi:hypothetical protein
MRRAATVSLAALAVAGCGGSDAGNALNDTSANLARIRSGNLAVRMTIEGTGAAARGGAVGFALRGPFALPKTRGLPRARLDYTQVAGDKRATVTLTTTSDAGYVTVGGRSYTLASDKLADLRTGGAGLAGAGGGKRLSIASWVKDPKVEDGGKVDGVDTDLVSGRLDVPAAARDLLKVATALGPGGDAARALQGQSAAELERAVKRASFSLRTGKEDRLLRRLAIAVDLAASGAPGARIRFDLAISRPGSRVEVKAAANPLPASALPSS